MLVLSVIYIPQKSSTFICLNTTSSEALLKFTCNRVSFEDSLLFDTEIQKVELRKPKNCSCFYSAVCSHSLSSLFASPANAHIVKRKNHERCSTLCDPLSAQTSAFPLSLSLLAALRLSPLSQHSLNSHDLQVGAYGRCSCTTSDALLVIMLA